MLNQKELIDTVAAYKKDSRKHFKDTVSALLALAWPYRKEKFVFDESFPLYDEAIALCMEMTDKCEASAKSRLASIVESLEWDGEIPEDFDARESMDMAGTHLLDLPGLWIGVAAANGWTESYTRVMISRYLSNPFTCPEWQHIPLGALAWGRGYARDIAEQLAVIGQGIIISGARYAEQKDEQQNGASYYIRHRGSTYDCDTCDALAERQIPIEVPFEIPHPRCVCWPEYF